MRTRTVSTPEVDLHVVEDGDPSKPAILFLHGFPDCHRVWEKQMAALSRSFHVISFDMRGCGRSGDPEGRDTFRIDRLLPDIAAVIDATRGKKGRVHLVGHDWGSVIGWSFVADPAYAKRVISWTSMSGPHVGLMWQWLFRRLRSGSLQQWREAAEQFAHSWYVFALNIPGAGRALFRFAGVEVWTRALQRGGVPPTDPYLDVGQNEVERMTLFPLRLYQQNAFRPPAPPAPGSITLPVQLIVPVDDEFVRPQLFHELGEVCTQLERVNIDANHWAQRSNPEQITILVREFVKRYGAKDEGLQRKAGTGNRRR
ncbi:MAG: alpha/beta fold hydrolase [Pseudomonadota bacterium]